MFVGACLASIELRAVRRSVFFCGNAVAALPEASSCEGPKNAALNLKKHRTSGVYSKKGW